MSSETLQPAPLEYDEYDEQEDAEPGEISRVRPSMAAADMAEAPLSREQFLMLAERARNQHARAIEQSSADMAVRGGLVDDNNLAKFTAFNSLVGHVYPEAAPERALVCGMWCNWLFFFDDLHDEDLGACRDLERVQDRMEHYLGLLLGVVAVPYPTPLERLTMHFRSRALELAGRGWLLRFCELVDAYFFRGVIPAIDNWRNLRAPPLAQYMEQREHDSAVMTAIDLIEIANGITIPDEVRNSPDVVRARRACALAVATFNDIVSYPKEVIRHSNPNNLVHVLMEERGIGLREAVQVATDIVNDAAYELLRAERRILAKVPPGPHPVKTYLHGMRAWQRGNIEYSLESSRYVSPWSPLVELRPAAITAA